MPRQRLPAGAGASGRTSRRAPPPWPSRGRRRGGSATGAYRSSASAAAGQGRVARHRGQHPRLDLAEVGPHEHVPRLGDDGRPQVGGHVVEPGRRRSSGRRRRRRPVHVPAAGRRRRRARRARRSRRSSPPARPCATPAGRRPTDGRRGAPPAARPGCRAPRSPTRRSSDFTCPGLRRSTVAAGGAWRSTSRVARSAALRRPRPRRAGRGPTTSASDAPRPSPGRPAGRRPPARRTAARRPTRTAPSPAPGGRGAPPAGPAGAAPRPARCAAQRASRPGSARPRRRRPTPAAGARRAAPVLGVAAVVGLVVEQVERAGAGIVAGGRSWSAAHTRRRLGPPAAEQQAVHGGDVPARRHPDAGGVSAAAVSRSHHTIGARGRPRRGRRPRPDPSRPPPAPGRPVGGASHPARRPRRSRRRPPTPRTAASIDRTATSRHRRAERRSDRAPRSNFSVAARSIGRGIAGTWVSNTTDASRSTSPA